MFKKTLRRLTVLNSIVFLFIFIVFGTTLYGYVAHQSFADIDDSMRRKAGAFRIINGRPGIDVTSRGFFDPRIFILLRDIDGNIINLYPSGVEGLAQGTSILHKVEAGALVTRRIEDHIYRIMSVPYEYSDNILIRADFTRNVVTEVIAISIVDSDVAMLKRLMLIIIMGQVVGVTAIVLAGYYLAQRALVPIRGAWEKQQQFVADASHELRTPLAVIKSNAELLLRYPEHTIEEETVRITNVVRETIRMSKLVSTLLTLARADANQIELQLAPLVLNEVINSVAEQFKPLAEMREIILSLEVEDEIELVADKERLHQLFVILLDNGIKYISQPGHIRLTCRKQANMALIKVADTGCGIPPEDLPYVFDRFFRGDKVRSREPGGTGLGLSIAKWIVEKHGGKIWVDSKVGIGTQVHVNLPIKKHK